MSTVEIGGICFIHCSTEWTRQPDLLIFNKEERFLDFVSASARLFLNNMKNILLVSLKTKTFFFHAFEIQWQSFVLTRIVPFFKISKRNILSMKFPIDTTRWRTVFKSLFLRNAKSKASKNATVFSQHTLSVSFDLFTKKNEVVGNPYHQLKIGIQVKTKDWYFQLLKHCHRHSSKSVLHLNMDSEFFL